MLSELKDMNIWIPYRVTDSGKQPSRFGYAPSRWKEPGKLTDYAGAMRLVDESEGRLQGVGMVVPDGFTIIDLDKCDVGPDNPVVKLFNSYTELSPSGKGLHIIIKVDEAGPKWDMVLKGVSTEFKTPGNFVTITEKPIWDKPIRTVNISEFRPAIKKELTKKLQPGEKKDKRAVGGVSVASTAYGKAALDRECGRVRAATKGSRNRTLYVASRCIGELVAGGEIAEQDARRALEQAGRYHGLAERDIEKGIENGLRDGSRSPRAAPKGPMYVFSSRSIIPKFTTKCF